MKRLVITTLQLLITCTLLWWIFRDPEKRTQMLAALRAANYLWLVPAALSIGVAFVLQTERWRLLLRAQAINLGWWRTFRVFLIGAFFNLFLFGATGGDVVKIFYAMRETASKKSAALLSVLVDRMMGLLGLVAITAVLCSLRLSVLLAHPLTRNLLGALAFIMGGFVSLIAFGFAVDRWHLAGKLPHWLPLRSRIIELATAFSTYARDPRVLAATFGLSLPAHLMIFLASYFTARAFGAFPGLGGLADLFSVLPIIMTIAALPISLSGMGVREQLFQDVLAELFGTPHSVAVVISITGFLLLVFWGLIGGLVYLAYRPSGGLHLKELEAEVEEAEKSLGETQ